MKKILVVGFGGMGCRHVQSLLTEKGVYEIHVVETYQPNIATNCERIGARPEDIHWHNAVDEMKQPADLAIIATSAEPRYEIVKKLIRAGVKRFLLEKIVFQSAQQFEEIVQLIEANGVKTYCNFVNRYFDAYNSIREQTAGLPGSIAMTVYGGAFGLGCNSIHYIDIFQYITRSNGEVKINPSQVSELQGENRRGKQYKEFTGSFGVVNEKGNQLNIISDPAFTGGVTIRIEGAGKSYLLSEESQKYFIGNNGKTEQLPFTILPTSRLTARIAKEILSDDCRLTSVQATRPAHEALFEVFNTVLNGRIAADMICPIT